MAAKSNAIKKKYSSTEARQHFSDIIGRASFGKERVGITKGKQTVAYIVPADDVEFLEELESRLDIEEARQREHEPNIDEDEFFKGLES